MVKELKKINMVGIALQVKIVKLFSKNCMYLLSSLIDTRPNLNLTHLERMKLFVFHYLGLLLREISSLMARIHVRATYVNELKV